MFNLYDAKAIVTGTKSYPSLSGNSGNKIACGVIKKLRRIENPS